VNCTVPSVKGLINLDYEKTDEGYVVNLTVPKGMKADLYVPDGATVNVNSKTYYKNGEYVKSGNVRIEEVSLVKE
jgi:hypothetical protein